VHGVLRSAVTVAHSDFYSYVPAGSTWTAGRETVDGTLRMQPSPHDPSDHPAATPDRTDGSPLPHPVTAQEAQGHGLKAYPQYRINGDGIVYYPATVADTPSGADDRDVRYQLIDIFAAGGLWAQRANGTLYAGLGTFAGDTSGGCGTGTYACGTDSANAPWGWDDADDLPARGEIATDPAALMANYFTVPGPMARSYTVNPYAAEAAALTAAARTTAPRIVDWRGNAWWAAAAPDVTSVPGRLPALRPAVRPAPAPGR
jgi:hypothetical protein